MKRDWVIVVDSNEKKPLLFPRHIAVLGPSGSWSDRHVVRIHTVSRRLPTGDYAIDGSDDVCVVERKGSLQEITHNCMHSRDKIRFRAELERLQKVAHPLLLVEGTPLDLLRESVRLKKPHLILGLDVLMRLLMEFGVGYMALPASTVAHRRATGNWVARYLVSGAIYHANRPGPLRGDAEC